MVQFVEIKRDWCDFG